MAQGDVGGLVFSQQRFLAIDGDFGSAADHHPVLGAVVVHLQRQFGARLHHDAFDLKTLARVYALVPAPGAVHAAVFHLFFALVLGKVSNSLFDVLRLVFVHDQHGIGRFHHHHIAQAHHGHQAAFGAHIAVVRAVGKYVAQQGVAVVILGGDVPQAVPRAHIAPAHVGGHHGGVAGGLHDGVINRFCWAGGKGGSVRAAKVGVLRAALPGGGGGLQDVGAVLLQFLQIAPGGK